MTKPQGSDLRRSGRNPALDPDTTRTRIEAEGTPETGGPPGTVPPENRPGHHPGEEQDRPDPEDFLRRSHERAIEHRHHDAGPDEGSPVRTVADLRRRGVTSGMSAVTHLVRTIRHVAAFPLQRLAAVLEPSDRSPDGDGDGDGDVWKSG